MVARNDIRAKIFAAKPQSRIVQFNGVDIEIRQPNIGSVLDAGDVEDRKRRVIRGIINCCYVPNTDEKVFEEADFELMLSIPMSGEWNHLMETMTELTEIGTQAKEQVGN